MRKVPAAICIFLGLSAPWVASAQLGGLSLPGLGNKNPSGASDATGSQDQLVRQYVAAGQDVLDANGHMADALGLKQDAADARAASNALTEGSTQGAISAADKTSNSTSADVAATMKNPPAMDAQSKANYTQGLVSLAQGLLKYIGMRGAVDSFRAGLSSASPMMIPKLQSGAYIVKTMPGNLSNVSSSLSSAVAFAKAHDIAVPADATKALGAV